MDFYSSKELRGENINERYLLWDNKTDVFAASPSCIE